MSHLYRKPWFTPHPPHRGSIYISESDQGLHKPSEIEFSHRILIVYQKSHWKTLISDKVTASKRSEIPSTKYQGFPTIKKKRPYIVVRSEVCEISLNF